MAIADHLSAECVVFLHARSKTSALDELAERIVASGAGVLKELILDELWKRERFLSTRVSDNIAIPHAIIRSMSRTMMAVGVSRDGVPYEDSKAELPVQIIVAPLRSCQSWSGLRRVGSWWRPPSRPSSTGPQGGRAVVAATGSSCGPAEPSSLAEPSWQRRPWQGPMVTVV